MDYTVKQGLHQVTTSIEPENVAERRSLEGAGGATRVFSVTSGKGGVGKTVLTANLAVTLARLNRRVLIIDANLGLANIDVVFGLTPDYNLNHFFNGDKDLDSILVNNGHGVWILPAGSGSQNFIRLDSRQKLRLVSALESMHGNFDVVLIDTETGISENATYFNTVAQDILVVTTPEPTAITDAYALMKLLSTQYHEKHFNLIVNITHNEKEALDVYRKLTMVANRYLDIAIDYLGALPMDRQIMDSVRRQQLVVDLYPNAKICDAFENLARRLIQVPRQTQPKGSIQLFWKKFLDLTP